MAGLTPEGLVIKRYSQILAEKRTKAEALFLDLVPPGDRVDTSDSTTLGRLIALSIPGEADIWEAMQEVYDGFNPNAAEGIALDNLVALGGITRREATHSVVPLLLSGDVGTLVPLGRVVSSPTTGHRFLVSQPVGLTADSASGVSLVVTSVEDSTSYSLTYTVAGSSQNVTVMSGVGATAGQVLSALNSIIGSAHPTLVSRVEGSTLVVDRVDAFQRATFSTTSNLGIVKVRKIGEGVAEEAGPIEQPANTVNNITTPILGWDSATNPIPATVGSLRETDEQLRLRFRNSKFQRSVNTADAIYTAILGVQGVEEVQLYENDTDVVDANGLPPHSFLPVVVGGSSLDIGNAIWRNKPVGILSAGNTSVTVEDIQGFSHTVRFERPNPVVVYIRIELTLNEGFPPNGEDLMKSAIVSYFRERFGVGDDVIYSRVFTPVNSLQGHQVDDMKIGTDPNSLGYGNIPVAFNEIASISDVNIEIIIN